MIIYLCGSTIRINKLLLLLFLVFIFTVYVIFSSSSTVIENSSRKTKLVNLKYLLINSIIAAIKGGEEVVETSKQYDVHIQTKGYLKEGQEDRVTDADYKSHCAMLNELRSVNNKLSIVSEESANCDSYSSDKGVIFNFNDILKLEDIYEPIDDITIWIDPLDSTQEYTEKIYDYVTTAVCIAIKDKPIIGVVHKPFDSKTSWAWNSVSLSNDLQETPFVNQLTKSVIVSRSHAGDVDKIKSVLGEDINILRAAGSGYKALQLAYGLTDAYVHITSIKKWDTCASDAIIKAMGGTMKTLKGENIDYADTNNVVNTDGLLASFSNFDLLLSKLKNIQK